MGLIRSALTDTHCHLNFNDFDVDRAEVIQRAKQAGIVRIINPGIDLETSRDVLGMAELYPEVYAAVGVHPNHASGWNEQSLYELRDLCRHPKVVAIGEMGLDYYRDYVPRSEQRRIFRQQLELASEMQLPVIIHNRLAHDDISSTLTDWVKGIDLQQSNLALRPGVLHSFSGDINFYERISTTNFFIGISGPVTYKNAALLRELVISIPLERILVETDAPFLAPHPVRGKRNEPAYVSWIAGKIAELKGCSQTEVATLTTANASRLFFGEELLE